MGRAGAAPRRSPPQPWRRGLPALWLGGALALSPLTLIGGAGDDIATKEQTLRSMEQEMERISEQMGTEREQRDALQEQLHRLEEAIAESARDLRHLSDEIDTGVRHLTEIDTVRLAKQKELVASRSRLAAQMRAAYALGRHDRLKLMLNQEDPADVSRLLAYHNYLTRARADQVAAVTARTRELDQLLEDLRQNQTRLTALRVAREKERSGLAERQTERSAVLEALNLSLDAQGRQLRDLEVDANGMRSLIENLRREAVIGLGRDFEPIARLQGRLPWPVKGRLEARFGVPKEKESMRWDGVFIAAREGDEVHAVHIGRVVYADWLRGFGLLLILDHGDGYMSLYGHNQTLLKEVGEWVQRGDPVALVGSSGGRPRAGLYFAIRRQGKPVDPAQWCVGARGSQVGATTEAESARSGTNS